MSHLSLETLARLLDEAPTAAEGRHLDECSLCREEFDALGADLAGLAQLPALLPPPAAAWPALQERLRAEGLIRAAPARGHLPGNRYLRLAAALALFLSGAITGFLLRGEAGAGPAGIAYAPVRPASGAPVGGVLTGNSSISASSSEAAAARALTEAEAAYRAALARYAELASGNLAMDPLARLAALEDIVVTTRDALAAAPADPLINGYHMTALAQRDATVRQLALSSNDRWY
jgi:predicted anti-sigma-YlaC factor YlaD